MSGNEGGRIFVLLRLVITSLSKSLFASQYPIGPRPRDSATDRYCSCAFAIAWSAVVCGILTVSFGYENRCRGAWSLAVDIREVTAYRPVIGAGLLATTCSEWTASAT